jgi:hypothetical protein
MLTNQYKSILNEAQNKNRNKQNRGICERNIRRLEKESKIITKLTK